MVKISTTCPGIHFKAGRQEKLKSFLLIQLSRMILPLLKETFSSVLQQSASPLHSPPPTCCAAVQFGGNSYLVAVRLRALWSEAVVLQCEPQPPASVLEHTRTMNEEQTCDGEADLGNYFESAEERGKTRRRRRRRKEEERLTHTKCVCVCVLGGAKVFLNGRHTRQIVLFKVCAAHVRATPAGKFSRRSRPMGGAGWISGKSGKKT